MSVYLPDLSSNIGFHRTPSDNGRKREMAAISCLTSNPPGSTIDGERNTGTGGHTMPELVRTSVSIEKPLFKRLEKLVRSSRYTNRSEIPSRSDPRKTRAGGMGARPRGGRNNHADIRSSRAAAEREADGPAARSSRYGAGSPIPRAQLRRPSAGSI